METTDNSHDCMNTQTGTTRTKFALVCEQRMQGGGWQTWRSAGRVRWELLRDQRKMRGVCEREKSNTLRWNNKQHAMRNTCQTRARAHRARHTDQTMLNTFTTCG